MASALPRLPRPVPARLPNRRPCRALVRVEVALLLLPSPFIARNFPLGSLITKPAARPDPADDRPHSHFVVGLLGRTHLFARDCWAREKREEKSLLCGLAHPLETPNSGLLPCFLLRLLGHGTARR